jgi:hypothetical protein
VRTMIAKGQAFVVIGDDKRLVIGNFVCSILCIMGLFDEDHQTFESGCESDLLVGHGGILATV